MACRKEALPGFAKSPGGPIRPCIRSTTTSWVAVDSDNFYKDGHIIHIFNKLIINNNINKNYILIQ